ncbi:MAG: sensor histidine kinase [Acidimicrobiales bacterium]
MDGHVRAGHQSRAPVVARIGRWLRAEPDGAGPESSPGAGRELWRRVAEASARHPRLLDVALAATVALVSTPWLFTHRKLGTLAWLVQVLLIVPLVWRRRYPIGVLGVLVAAALVQWLSAAPYPAEVSLLVALYTIATLRPRRVVLGAAAVIEVGCAMATLRWARPGGEVESFVLLSGLLWAAVLLGANLRGRRRYLAGLIERAERLEHERDQQARMAAAAERTRIAREMHDIVAHSLAVIVAMADGATAKLRRDPEQAAAAIANVSDVGRQALAETRRLLGVLRTDQPGDGRAPQPGIDQLGDLVAQVRATGLDARLEVEGVATPLPAGAALAVYRIVQEAATNTLKHAPGAKAFSVRISYGAAGLEVEVSDDGPVGRPVSLAGVAGHGAAGHGIAGMRERAAVYHGSVSAGPGSDGHWTVRAALPITPVRR